MTKTFRDLGVDPALCDALADGGITHPFPIQELTLPLALDGHDLIGQARTGTGKTLAFGLPLLQRLDPASKHTQALVIVPTRELCLQVYADLQIGAAKGLTSISVYGGVGYDEQIDALAAGAHVVVGTPGRLLDLLNRGVLDLSKVTQLVLDEADEMLDMGFLPDVERLVEACRGGNRHTMLFSATMPTAIVKLARRYMDHPTFTRADHEQKNTAPLVTQYFFEVHRMDKPRLLARILQSKERGGVYVFVRTKHMADRLVNDLEELRIPSIAIHGDLRQTTREKNLDRFRSGQATVLVCTEVAARGLDVSGVTHVINYDCPDDEKMYLHRIGRTARAGEAGVAITFAEFNEIDRLNVIRKAVGEVDTEVRQIFSTSKQLSELFELPDERPWDHLTTKAGSDEARAKRESRTDGKPKSGRSQEGRGGDRDARRPSGDRDTRKPSNDRDTRKPSNDRDDQQPGTSRTKGADARTERGDSARGTAGDRGATRTRTRTRARSTTSGRGEDERSNTSPSPASSRTEPDTATRRRPDRRADAEPVSRSGSGSDAGTEEDAGSRSPSARKRARGGRPRGDQRNAAAEDDRGKTSSGEARNGSRSQKGRSGGARSGGSRSGGSRSGDARTSGGRQGARDTARSGRDGDARDDKRSDAGSGGSRGRSSGRSARSDKSTEADATVTVAKRGEDARGDGQPQVSRRVKIEHLP